MRNTLLKIASVLLLAPTVALAGGPVAQPSCAQVICLSPDHGKAPPAYFVIRVFDPLYDPGATADARHAFLRTCLTAQSSDLQIIKLKYGRLYADPITF